MTKTWCDLVPSGISSPPELSLFPATEGTATTLTLPRDFAAGEHTVLVRVTGTTDLLETAAVPLALQVAPVYDAGLSLEPQSVTAGRRARFTVVGAFTLSGLKSPDTYLVTVTMEGFATQTALVPVSEDGAVVQVGVLALGRGSGSVTGTVTGEGLVRPRIDRAIPPASDAPGCVLLLVVGTTTPRRASLPGTPLTRRNRAVNSRTHH